MQFEITVKVGMTYYRMQVNRTWDKKHETYVVTSNGKSVTFMNDIPFNKSKQQRHWDPRWRQTAGIVMRVETQAAIINAILDHFDPPPPKKEEPPSPPYVAPGRHGREKNKG